MADKIWIECEIKPKKNAIYERRCIATTSRKIIKKIAKRLEYEGVNKFECNSLAKWAVEELLGE